MPFFCLSSRKIVYKLEKITSFESRSLVAEFWHRQNAENGTFLSFLQHRTFNTTHATTMYQIFRRLNRGTSHLIRCSTRSIRAPCVATSRTNKLSPFLHFRKAFSSYAPVAVDFGEDDPTETIFQLSSGRDRAGTNVRFKPIRKVLSHFFGFLHSLILPYSLFPRCCCDSNIWLPRSFSSGKPTET